MDIRGARLRAVRAPPQAWRFFPLGVELVVQSASPDLLAVVAAFCAPLHGGGQGAGEAQPVRIRLKISDAACHNATPRIEADATRLSIGQGGIRAAACSRRRCGVVSVARGWLETPERLREEVIEPLVLFLVARADRTPVHAAGFLLGDCAVLLAGPSGAGKSSLALAAHRAGLPVLSEDTLYVQQHPTLRVWGGVEQVHLLPRDVAAATTDGFRDRNGKRKSRITLGRPFAAISAPRAAVLVLAHGGGVAIEAISQREALAALWPLEAGFDLMADQSARVLEALTAKGAWRLTLSADAQDAIALLGQRGADLTATASP